MDEGASRSPDLHHTIGKSQNDRIHIGLFLQEHADDPALSVRTQLTLVFQLFMFIQDFVPKLKQHLLGRMKSLLQREAQLEHLAVESTTRTTNDPPPTQTDSPLSSEETNNLLFKDNTIFSHRILRLNYTTYDVRRAEDVIHARTPHCNVMGLVQRKDDDDITHPFWYARVVGIYHANMMYIGAGSRDYRYRRMEFLLVRWYECVDNQAGWDSRRLDTLRFPVITSRRAFGFIDPADVLRGCHLIPKLAKGKVDYLEGDGMSKYAQDHQDWHLYYANRCVQFTIYSDPYFTSFIGSLDLLTVIWLCGITGVTVLGMFTHIPASACQPIF